MASKTEIANLALSHLGHQKEIANIETEKSAEAATMRRFYPVVAKIFLKDFPYSFCTVNEPLDLVEEDPNDEWDYAYRYPSDCLLILRIPSGKRDDTRQSRVNYIVGKDSSGELIFTDQDEARAEYVQMSDDPNKYPIDVILTMSLLLAGLAAPRICGEDPFKMGERAMKLYQYFKGISDAINANEEQRPEPPEAEQIRARD